MPYAKTGQRAERRLLPEKMRGLGMSHRQIAAEFARRYGLRPRAAWRHAYGWPQTEAAEQISTYAARAGMSSDGATVTMTGPHLCEYENWPGEGPEPTGRRTTPYLLSLLAGVYEFTVHDLLDVADYEHMPPADRLVVGKSPPVAGQHDHPGPSASDMAASAKTAAKLPPSASAARPRTAAAGPTGPQPRRPSFRTCRPSCPAAALHRNMAWPLAWPPLLRSTGCQRRRSSSRPPMSRARMPNGQKRAM